MNKILIILTFSFMSLFSLENESPATFIKEKQEIKSLKQELNSFYDKKEQEYKKRKEEITSLLSKVEKEKKEIENLYNDNKAILNDIEGVVSSKTSKIYNSMKPKTAASIFNKMMNDGKIEDVFDIILKLKEKNVTYIMKFLSIDNASIITQMLQNFKVKNNEKGNNG